MPIDYCLIKEGAFLTNGKNRSYLLGIVGAYLIYLAYQLFEGRAETDTTMTPAVRYVFIALFVIAGIALAVYAVIVWKQSGKEEEKEEKPKQDETALK